ncbi:hypothetical protein EFR28_03570 [Latilactobacillus curvatus]|uniref:Uncharacterized protein n=1 Tax=Latilactobacillus curvatus TaxID=28038 RepID=A0A385ABX0_LATCU|nr:hypothetical protein DT351_01555 [Latilactobacillus curvatus]MCT3525087.1 hypothetical protein [Latilactobacillus curvatus]
MVVVFLVVVFLVAVFLAVVFLAGAFFLVVAIFLGAAFFLAGAFFSTGSSLGACEPITTASKSFVSKSAIFVQLAAAASSNEATVPIKSIRMFERLMSGDVTYK